MIQYIIGGVVGLIIGEVVKYDKEKKETPKDSKDFFVLVYPEDHSKTLMVFKDYESARNMFYKISKLKKVSYEDLVSHSETEKELYEKWKSEGKLGTSGFKSSLKEEYKVDNVEWGKGVTTFEEKEF